MILPLLLIFTEYNYGYVPPPPKKNHAEVGSHFTFLHVIWHLVVLSLDVCLSSLKMLLVGEVDLYYDLNASASS